MREGRTATQSFPSPGRKIAALMGVTLFVCLIDRDTHKEKHSQRGLDVLLYMFEKVRG